MTMNEEESLLAEQLYQAFQDASNNSARSAQQSDFIIGVSDIGVCSERVGRMLDGIPEPRTDKLEAFMGTAVGDHGEAAIAAAFPEALRHTAVSVVLQVPGSAGAYKISGHPDIVMPWGVIDLKTSDGLEVAERTGATFQQLFQRHAYTKGAHEAGLLAVPLEEARTANVWIDRSGATKHLHVQMDHYSEDVVAEGARWLDEVYYAHDHKLRYAKEPPREWCRKACGHFADCRLYDSDVTGLLTDEKVLAAVGMYQEGKDLKREGDRLQKEAKPVLEGIEGYTHDFQVRWVEVEGGQVAYARKPYAKLSISKRSDRG